jgi:uncharacterized protein (TIGR02646 family)
MRYIKKGWEPSSLTAWKAQKSDNWQPTYSDLRGEEKQDVYAALLQEQGYACCYCGMRISQDACHIEHLKPQSLFPDLTLDYANLLASCMGTGSELKPEDKLATGEHSGKHCGRKRGNWYDAELMVSPLLEDCADYFRYTAAGEILPTHEQTMQAAAQTTIQQLNLNYSPLQTVRQATIASILTILPELTSEEVQKFINGYAQPNYAQPNNDGKIGRFAGAVIYTLQQWLSGD